MVSFWGVHTINQSHRYGRPRAACREPAGSYDKTTRTAICFEHKTQYLLIRAPYTRIVVFWHTGYKGPVTRQNVSIWWRHHGTCVESSLAFNKMPVPRCLWSMRLQRSQCWQIWRMIYLDLQYYLTHWGREKMVAIFQTTFSNALKFHWKLLFRVHLTFLQYWFR